MRRVDRISSGAKPAKQRMRYPSGRGTKPSGVLAGKLQRNGACERQLDRSSSSYGRAGRAAGYYDHVDASEHIGEPRLRIDVVEPRGLDPDPAITAARSPRDLKPAKSHDLRPSAIFAVYSAHTAQGGDIVVHYRWHRCTRAGRAAHSDRAAGNGRVRARRPDAWRCDDPAGNGRSMRSTAPLSRSSLSALSLAALFALHELLIACESRLVCADGNVVTQEAQDGIAAGATLKGWSLFEG